MPGVNLLLEADDRASPKIQKVEAEQSRLEKTVVASNTKISKSADLATSRWERAGNAIGGAATKIKSKVEAAARASTDFAERLNKDFGKLAAVTALSGLAFAGQAAFIKNVTAEAAAQELAVVKLETSLKAEQRTRVDSIAILEAQADALQRTTVFADEQTIAMQAQLAGFGLTTDEILKLTPRVQDLATFLQRTSSETVDLTGVTLALGRALSSGSAGALSRYGISLKLAEGETLTFNRLLQELQKHAGLAAAAGDTFSGKMARLGHEVSEVKEALGRALIPAITEVVRAITPTIQAFAKWADAHPKLIAWIIGGGAAGAGLVGALGALALLLTQLPAILAVATGPVGAITIAFVSLAAAIALGNKRLYEIPKTLKEVNAEIPKTEAYLRSLKDYEDKLTSSTFNLEKAFMMLVTMRGGGPAAYFAELARRTKEAEERLKKLREEQNKMRDERREALPQTGATSGAGSAAAAVRGDLDAWRKANEVRGQLLKGAQAEEAASTKEWLAQRIALIEANYHEEAILAERTTEEIAVFTTQKAQLIADARKTHARATAAVELKEAQRLARARFDLEKEGIPKQATSGVGSFATAAAADVELWRKSQEQKEALTIQTIARTQTYETAWLTARTEQINQAYQAEVLKAEGNAARIAELRIERDNAVMEARMENEDAILEHWMETNQIQMLGIESLEAAYDTFFQTILQKEMSGKERREAMWSASKNVFIRNTAQMMKAMIAEHLKASIVGDAIARKSATARKLGEAKIGAVRAYQAFAGIPIVGPVLGAAAAAAAFAFLIAFQRGGQVPGVRTGRDSVPARLEPKEYVIRRKSAERIGTPTLEHINRTGQLPVQRVIERQPIMSRSVEVRPMIGASFALQFNLSGGPRRELENMRDQIIDKVAPVLEELMEDGHFRGTLDTARPLDRKKVA